MTASRDPKAVMTEMAKRVTGEVKIDPVTLKSVGVEGKTFTDLAADASKADDEAAVVNIAELQAKKYECPFGFDFPIPSVTGKHAIGCVSIQIAEHPEYPSSRTGYVVAFLCKCMEDEDEESLIQYAVEGTFDAKRALHALEALSVGNASLYAVAAIKYVKWVNQLFIDPEGKTEKAMEILVGELESEKKKAESQ